MEAGQHRNPAMGLREGGTGAGGGEGGRTLLEDFPFLTVAKFTPTWHHRM